LKPALTASAAKSDIRQIEQKIDEIRRMNLTENEVSRSVFTASLEKIIRDMGLSRHSDSTSVTNDVCRRHVAPSPAETIRVESDLVDPRIETSSVLKQEDAACCVFKSRLAELKTTNLNV